MFTNHEVQRMCLYCLFMIAPAYAGVIHVDVDAKGSGTGQSWTDAFTSLPDALANASAADQLWVAEGTYSPVTLKSGVEIIGGFTGIETAASASDPAQNITYISGGGTSRALTSKGNNSATIVRGFHITGGFVAFPEKGGGAYLENSDVIFVRCVFTLNTAGLYAGAACIDGGSPTFVNCRFSNNESDGTGGAIFVHHTASPTFVNCLFSKNTAKEAGAISVLTGTPTLINCTIADNRSTVGKAGAFFDTRGETTLHNCIVWNNVSPVTSTNDIYNHPRPGKVTLASHSNIQGGWPGEGNLAAASDPRFVDPANGDYRLRSDSPCRDAGLLSALPNDIADVSHDGNKTGRLPNDLGMGTRVEGGAVDIGAFEWHP